MIFVSIQVIVKS